jgi:hypothetical protein
MEIFRILAEQDRSSEAYALFIISVNEMIDYPEPTIDSSATITEFPFSLIITLFIIEIFFHAGTGLSIWCIRKKKFQVEHGARSHFLGSNFLNTVLDRPELGLAKVEPETNAYAARTDAWQIT